jgi:hypothetical protein
MTNVLAVETGEVDVRSLAAKLNELHAQLTPGEQALLHEVLQPAAAGDTRGGADVAGFAWAVGFNPFAYWCGYCRPADLDGAGGACPRR